MATTPEERHCADGEMKRYTLTPYFVLAWLGILIYLGGLFGDRHNQDLVWNKMPHGLYIPFLLNAMPRDAF